MTSEHIALRKAAVLIRSLDRATADGLLAQLPTDQAARIRQIARTLVDIDPLEQQEVLDEFLHRGPRRQPDAGGVELAGSLAGWESTGGEQTAYELKRAPARPAASFERLHGSNADELARLLVKEHPQTIALVMAHLGSAYASEVLACFDRELQLEVLRRLLDLDEANPDALETVKRKLESRLQAHLQGKQRRAAGLATVRQILTAAGPIAERELRSTIESADPSLARLLRTAARSDEVPSARPPVEFEDLSHLDDASLRKVAKHTPREYLVLAVAGAPLRMAERILRLLPSGAGKQLREAVNRIGAVRISDLETAQAEMARVAESLGLADETQSGAVFARGGAAR